jgi:hypothetical protein
MNTKNTATKKNKLTIILNKIIKSKPDPKWSKLRKMSQDQFQNYLDNLYCKELNAS